MKYNELVAKTDKSARRSGRGISAGQGKTAGRGTKGQGSRKSTVKKGFSGGQTPIYMQLPKLRGFKSHRQTPEVIFTDQLDSIKKTVVDTHTLAEAGLISNPYVPVKLISRGELKSKKTLKLQKVSRSAAQTVEKAGGKIDVVPRLARSKTSAKTIGAS